MNPKSVKMDDFRQLEGETPMNWKARLAKIDTSEMHVPGLRILGHARDQAQQAVERESKMK